jgi:hypothetical protein
MLKYNCKRKHPFFNAKIILCIVIALTSRHLVFGMAAMLFVSVTVATLGPSVATPRPSKLPLPLP